MVGRLRGRVCGGEENTEGECVGRVVKCIERERKSGTR